jgi:hypothetical protein
MVSNLPSKRESQGLIAGHKRRLASGRIIDVNKGVPSRSKRNRKAFLPRNRAKIVPKKQEPKKRKNFLFPIRKRQNVDDPLISFAKKHFFTQDSNGQWLLEGQRSFRRFKGIWANSAIFENWDGSTTRLAIDKTIPQSEYREELDYLFDYLNKPLIIAFIAPSALGVTKYTRDYIRIPLRKTIELNNSVRKWLNEVIYPDEKNEEVLVKYGFKIAS